MNASSRQNLSDALIVDENVDAHERRTGGALDGVTDTARFSPDESDMHLGRERPPPTGPGTVIRGVAEGVAHAPDASVTAADSRADCDTGGKERRPIDRGEVADRKEHRHFTD